jgi:hypothetical protein
MMRGSLYVGMLAIDKLEEKRWQELPDRVHQMQVNGEIGGKKGSRTFGEMRLGAIAHSKLFPPIFFV